MRQNTRILLVADDPTANSSKEQRMQTLTFKAKKFFNFENDQKRFSFKV